MVYSLVPRFTAPPGEIATRANGHDNGSGPPVEVIFVHGFASSALDLMPLAAAFAYGGAVCHVLTLDGHPDDLGSVTVDRWLAQVREAVDTSQQRGARTYLVGFSYGAALALRVASERAVDGVLCISAFAELRRKRLASLALRFSQFPPVGSRRPRTTVKHTRAELRWTGTIPTSTVKHVLAAAPDLASVPNTCPVLFIHSVDDPVADYGAIARRVRAAASNQVRLVTLTGLEHFIQFDISPHRIRDLAVEHFKGRVNESPAALEPTQAQALEKREDEIRHWANVLSVLVLGFFASFGAILNATLPDVINKSARAPYYLVGYPAALALYLGFAFLYLFYLDRAQAYVRIFLDPLQETGIGWIAYRTNRWVSGRASHQMTRLIAGSSVLLPSAVAIASLTYAASAYHAKLFAANGQYVFLRLLAVIAVVGMVQAAYAGIRVTRYSRVHLYTIPSVVPASRDFLRALQDLYTSVLPGSVRQPPASEDVRVETGAS